MKKYAAFLLAMLIVVFAPALANGRERYLEAARDAAVCAGRLATDEVYLAYYGLNAREDLRDVDFENIGSAYIFHMPDRAEFGRYVYGLTEAEASDFALTEMLARLPSGCFISGDENRIAYSGTYLMTDGFVPCALLLECGGVYVGVAFEDAGEGGALVTAVILPHDERGAEEIAEEICREIPCLTYEIFYDGVNFAGEPPDADGDVYVTETGKKFHRAGCRTIADSPTKRAISREDAESEGYEPCKVCEP